MIASAASNSLLLLSESGSARVAPLAGGMLMHAQAAGDEFEYPWGVWASYQSSRFEDSFLATATDSDSDTVLIGADFSPWPSTVFGLALGYDLTQTQTTFNAGEQENRSFMVVPYRGALISDQLGVDFDLSVDFALGYSSVDIDQFRTTAGTRVSSVTDADRWFWSSNLTAGKPYGNWYLSGKLGWLFARDDTAGFTESDGTVNPDLRAELGQLHIGGNVAYKWGSFEPFVNATYEYDYDHEDIILFGGSPHPNDADGVLFGTGVRWYSDNGVTAAFEYNTVLDRDNVEADSFTFQLRAEF